MAEWRREAIQVQRQRERLGDQRSQPWHPCRPNTKGRRGAQWNRNHVAYVDDVGIDYIEITADNYVTRTTEHFLIRNGSPYWPDNFIHFKDLPKFGDLNGDYRVDVIDLSILESRWGTSDPASDLSHDGTVYIFDLSILLSHWSSNHTFADLAK
jgi:hypothetical protein